MKLSTSSYLLALGSKYYLQQYVHKHPAKKKPSFTPTQDKKQNYDLLILILIFLDS